MQAKKISHTTLKLDSLKAVWSAAFIAFVVSPLVSGCGLQGEGAEELQRAPGAANSSSAECGSVVTSEVSENGVPLGLSVVGRDGESLPGRVKLDCEKDLAIFIHGWSIGGIPVKFEHAAEWQDRGFQTLMFRWHDLSTNPDFEEVFVNTSLKAAERLKEQLVDLYKQLGGDSFQKEIRLIGHSFGAKVAIDATSAVSEPFPGVDLFDLPPEANVGRVPVARLTLLDPAIFYNWEASGQDLCTMLQIRHENQETLSRLIVKESGRIRTLLGQLPENIAVEVYAANVASTFSYDLVGKYQVQTLTGLFMFGCHTRFHNLNIVDVHTSVIHGYLGSIASERPKTSDGRLLNSAATPTAELLNQEPSWYILKEGEMQSDWNDHVYEKKGLPSRFFRLNVGEHCSTGGNPRECAGTGEYVVPF